MVFHFKKSMTGSWRPTMLDFKKKVDVKPQEELEVKECPVCNKFCQQCYYMEDKDSKKKSRWGHCSCGVVFNYQKPTKVYDQKYWDDNNKPDKGGRRTAFEYPVRIYSPLIEDLIYGRRVLIIGRPNPYQEEAFEERGWVPTIIDKNTSFNTEGNLIASDFETHQFSKETKFNLIWIYHTLECFNDPIGSLDLMSKLLAEDGIIFIGTPDTDFINTRSSSCFIHWKHDQNHIMWNRRSLASHLEKLGFNVILNRQNYENRFPMWDDLHLLAQKRFF